MSLALMNCIEKPVQQFQEELTILLESESIKLEVAHHTLLLAELYSSSDVHPEDKIALYFDNIKEDLEILYGILPAIGQIRHIECLAEENPLFDGQWPAPKPTQKAAKRKDTVSENEELAEKELVRMCIQFATSTATTLRATSAAETPWPEESRERFTTLARDFEAEAELLRQWNNSKCRDMGYEARSKLLSLIGLFKGKLPSFVDS